MDIEDMKSVLEVARCGSISAASKRLFVAQPNLSRMIHNLESEYGITIFKRVHKGMIPTKEGAMFLRQLGNILAEAQKLNNLFTQPAVMLKSISLSVPRASYISESFSEFLTTIPSDLIGIIRYDECSSLKAVQNLRESRYGIAIIRYFIEDESYYQALAKLERLSINPISEFTRRMLVSRNSPLASAPSITEEELENYVEILHGDEVLPGADWVRSANMETSGSRLRKKIFITERGSQFDLLGMIPSSYMWVSPMPNRFLEELQLAEVEAGTCGRRMRDALIYSSNHFFTQAEKDFLEILMKNVREGGFDKVLYDIE